MTRGNEPAYPTDAETLRYSGLTIREHFAAMAMQGVCASYAHPQSVGLGTTGECAIVAQMACAIADATLAELERTK